MRAMVLRELTDLRSNPSPLVSADLPAPTPGPHEVLLRVSTCGVCHTELDEIEGRTPPPLLPVILGHQVVGIVVQTGSEAQVHATGDRVGVGWIFSACGTCTYCKTGDDNLCARFKATGRDSDGGYAEYMVVPQNFAYAIPNIFSDVEAAPLLCAGAIGYRSLRLAKLRPGQRLGLMGFGASAHIVLKMVRHRYPDVEVFVFARKAEEREFALALGATWAGTTEETPPAVLDSVIDTTPVWKPVVEALRHLAPGGRLVINAIRKENVDKDYLMNLEYDTHLWHEREIKSVANVSRRDIIEFLELAAAIPLRPETEEYPLEDANRALVELRTRHVKGAKVLRVAG